jgi:hypothetical protein
VARAQRTTSSCPITSKCFWRDCIRRRADLWKLVEVGYTMDWFCYLGSHAAEHAAVLSRELMQKLLDVPGDVLLDIYDDYDETN